VMQNQTLVQLSRLPTTSSDDTSNKINDEAYLNQRSDSKLNQQKTPGNQSYVNAPQNNYDSANVAYLNASLQSAPNTQKISDGNDIYLEVDDDGPRSIRKPGPSVGMFYHSAACSITVSGIARVFWGRDVKILLRLSNKNCKVVKCKNANKAKAERFQL